MVKDNVLQKIQKLLNMTTERGCTQSEAESAMLKVQQLLFKYKLSMADIPIAEDEPVTKLTQQTTGLGTKKHEGQWRPVLVNSIARYNFCKAIGTGGDRVHLVGTEIDLEVVKDLYYWITEQLEGFCREAAGGYQGPDRIPTFKRSFYLAAAHTIGNRLYRQWRDLSEETEMSTALVVVTAEAIKDYVKVQFGTLHTTRSPYSGSYDGHRAGRTAGERTDLTPSKKLARGD